MKIVNQSAEQVYGIVAVSGAGNQPPASDIIWSGYIAGSSTQTVPNPGIGGWVILQPSGPLAMQLGDPTDQTVIEFDFSSES